MTVLPPRLALILLTLAATPLAAETLTAQGMAALDAAGSRETARAEAIRDALEQASLEAGAQVAGSSPIARPDQGSLSVNAQRRPSQFRLKREWTDKGLLMVEVEADFPDDSAASPRPTSQPVQQTTSCAGNSQPRYRKTIAVAPFLLMQAGQADDLDNPGQGVPNELLRRLEASKRLLPTVNANANVFGGTASAAPLQADPEAIKQVALNTNSQFVLTGRVLDTSVSARQTRPYWGWQSADNGSPHFGVALPGSTLGAGVAQQATQRRFEIELQIYDGATAVLLARQTLQQEASGKVATSSRQAFGSSGFLASDYGRAVDRVLNDATSAIDNTLACLPLTAKIVKIDGSRIYLNAGGLQQLRPGDTLTVYKKQTNKPVSLPETNEALGIPETPAASASIVQVQPRFAIAELSRTAGIRSGDLVRDDNRASSGRLTEAAAEPSTASDKAPGQRQQDGTSGTKAAAKGQDKQAKPAKKKTAKSATRKSPAKCDCPPATPTVPTKPAAPAKLS